MLRPLMLSLMVTAGGSAFAATTAPTDPAASLTQFFPGLTTSVEGTGIPGMDFVGCTSNATCEFFMRTAPTTAATANSTMLRLQREASYVGGQVGTIKSLWTLTYTSPQGAGYEWPITAEMYNQTDAATRAQNVAVNGTVFKKFKAGYNYGGRDIGPTWGGNFNCTDQTGFANPTDSCIGAEVDTVFMPGAGADPHQQRVGIQISADLFGKDKSASVDDHAATFILLGNNSHITVDHAISFRNAKVRAGVDFAEGTVLGEAVNLKQNDKLEFNGDVSGALSHYMYYDGAELNFSTPDNVLFSIDDGGNFVTAGAIVVSGSLYANALPTAPVDAVKGTLCVDVSGTVYVKTTPGGCL